MKSFASSLERRAGAEWPHWANVLLGFWLASTPFAFDHGSASMARSDFVTGLLLALFGFASIRYSWARWCVALIGVWLMFAPLVFWAPTSNAYNTSTTIGVLAIVFAILVPGERDRVGAITPPGWSYNPSAFIQRAPIIAFAFASFFIARHLAGYQLGYLATPWEPFFGEGTRRVLESDVSKSFPVSDAGLGAVSYLLEALSGFVGGEKRWRTMPWMVILFGILIVPLGVVSITLIVLQPVAVGAWCTLCLATAVLMLLMVSPAVDEVIASFQAMQRARDRGEPFWKSLFLGIDEGDGAPEIEQDNDFDEVIGFTHTPLSLVAAAILGIWLMAAPGYLGLEGAAAKTAYIVGPLVTTFAVIAMAEVARTVRWILIPLGLWLIVAQWLVAESPSILIALTGGIIAAISIPLGELTETYGGWERYIK